MNTLKQKHNRANGIRPTLRYYVTAGILKTIYYAPFDFHMRYACQTRGQIQSKTIETIDMIQCAQSKALRITSLWKYRIIIYGTF